MNTTERIRIEFASLGDSLRALAADFHRRFDEMDARLDDGDRQLDREERLIMKWNRELAAFSRNRR